MKAAGAARVVAAFFFAVWLWGLVGCTAQPWVADEP